MSAMTAFSPRKFPVALSLAVFGLIFLVIRQAGVVEDAYITFRVVDNAVYGFGLRWNIFERVQVYTHPLWMLLHIPFYYLWENIFYITLMLSVACTLAALVVSLRSFQRDWLPAVCFFLLPLAASPSFIRNSASGLENPLSHLLFACFGWALLRANSRYLWFYLSLFAALSMFNRLDTGILYIPVLAYLALSRRSVFSWKQCLAGGLPLALWLGFSLIYYGFLFPNTKYAKLNTGIAQLEYVRYGLGYLLDLAIGDTIGFACLFAAALGLPLARLFSARVRASVSPAVMWLATGVLLYAGYIISVGGAHVSGRFWSLPIFASVWILYAAVPREFGRPYGLGMLALVLVLSQGGWFAVAALAAYKACPSCAVMHVRPTGARIGLWDQKCPFCFDSAPIKVNRKRNAMNIFPRYRIGRRGYRLGPYAGVIDLLALSDPLLARLPTIYPEKGIAFEVGHMPRSFPPGYIHALRTGSLAGMHPALAEYYGKLRLIVSGDIWSRQRFKEIIKFNLGYYDAQRDTYVEAMQAATRTPPPEKPKRRRGRRHR